MMRGDVESVKSVCFLTKYRCCRVPLANSSYFDYVLILIWGEIEDHRKKVLKAW